MNITLETKVKTRIIDTATGKVLKESPWQKNLIMDNGLNALAGSTNATRIGNLTAACRIGSNTGVVPNSYASGAVTFTQVTTTITASADFFTAGMVGMLFKYGTGTGGAEYYITAFTNSTTVTVNTSATVAVPTVGTVWAVNQTTLNSLLYSSSTYETSGTSCQTTFATNVATYKRTFNFLPQVASYNVNEIGYFGSTVGTTVFGRLVLGSTDVVPPTSFYQVVLSVAVTYAPGAPLAVGDVGTNINTAGNAMLECISDSAVLSQVQSNGSSTGAGALDNASLTSPRFVLIIANYSQNAGTGNLVAVTRLEVAAGTWVYGGSLGKATLSFNTSISTSGQTLYGIGLTAGGVSSSCFDVKLTSPFALPSGTFLPQTVFALLYGRTLTN